MRRAAPLTGLAVSGAWVTGWSIAARDIPTSPAIAVALALAGAPIVGAVIRHHARPDFSAVELPALLILLSEVVLRQRDADALASNPLDPAGLYRVACLGLALVLGTLALTSPSGIDEEAITTRPFRTYSLYVAVVFIGAPLSVNWPLTAFRGVELLIGLLVVTGAYRRAGQESMTRLLSLLYGFTVVSVSTIWLGALIAPGSAFADVDSPFPVQLHGVFPVISANGTGLLGAILGLWSLAKLLSPQDSGGAKRRSLFFLTGLGFVTLALAQYRTGYLAAAAGLVVLLALRAKAAAFWLILVALIGAIVWSGTILDIATPIWQRGENLEVLSKLSGRFTFWQRALSVWETSPLFGRGLLTASRFEVLAEIGATRTSTIHGTWVEALVGTGLIGLTLLAASFLITLFRAFKEALRQGGLVVPLILLTILAVRSITGTTFETGGSGSLELITIALLLRDRSTMRPRSPVLSPSNSAR